MWTKLDRHKPVWDKLEVDIDRWMKDGGFETISLTDEFQVDFSQSTGDSVSRPDGVFADFGGVAVDSLGNVWQTWTIDGVLWIQKEGESAYQPDGTENLLVIAPVIVMDGDDCPVVAFVSDGVIMVWEGRLIPLLTVIGAGENPLLVRPGTVYTCLIYKDELGLFRLRLRSDSPYVVDFTSNYNVTVNLSGELYGEVASGC